MKKQIRKKANKVTIILILLMIWCSINTFQICMNSRLIKEVKKFTILIGEVTKHLLNQFPCEQNTI